MKIKQKVLSAFPLFLLVIIAAFMICKPKLPKPEPPQYEPATQTFISVDFIFEPSVGADLSKDNLALWHTRDGVNGSAYVNFPDSGKAVFFTKLRKTKDDVFPKLGVISSGQVVYKISPFDTMATFISDSIYVKPGKIEVFFIPDENDVESGVNLYIKSLKVSYLRRKT